MLLYFVAGIVIALTIGNSFSCLLGLFDVPPSLGFFFFFLNAFWHSLYPDFLLNKSLCLLFHVNNNDLLMEKIIFLCVEVSHTIFYSEVVP